MALKIFETDPDAAPKQRQRFADDIVGRFRSGHQLNKRPISLEHWRVTTGDPAVAERIRDLMGGDPAQEWDTQGEDNLEVFTITERLRIVIPGPAMLRQEMILRGLRGIIRRCDGVTQSGDGSQGKACECPQAYADRKAAAESGSGCSPETSLVFRLWDDPDLGMFRFRSGSWSLVRDIAAQQTMERLEEINGPTDAWLGLELVEFGEGASKKRFTKPTIDVIGAF